MTQRITHMLVLIDRNSAKGEAAFVQGMRGWLFAGDGRPYSQLVDDETKTHVMIVGPQVFNETYISDMASVHFPAVWNLTPVLRELSYQRFHGPEGNGTTIERREDVMANAVSTKSFRPAYPEWMVVPENAETLTIAADCEVLPWETFACPKCSKRFGNLPSSGPGVKYVFNYGMKGIAGGAPQSFAKVWWTEVRCCGQNYLVSNRGK